MSIESDRNLAGLRRAGRVGLDDLLTEGLVITIEPIIASGVDGTIEGPDGWTISTADGSPAAHHEHTIVSTKGSPIVLTAA